MHSGGGNESQLSNSPVLFPVTASGCRVKGRSGIQRELRGGAVGFCTVLGGRGGVGGGGKQAFSLDSSSPNPVTLVGGWRGGDGKGAWE